MQHIQKVQKIGLLRHMRAAFHSLPPQMQNNIIQYMIQYPYWGCLNPSKNDYTLFENRAETLWQHQQDFQWLYQHLADYRSKKVLLGILLNWTELDTKLLSQTKEINLG